MSQERDAALKRTEQASYDRARKLGFDDSRAKKIAGESTEKADATKKKLGHW